MTPTTGKRAFTLIELMVVVAMIAIIAGSMTTAVRGATERARIQRAVSEEKAITQAILGYENHVKNYELPTFESPVDVDSDSLGFLLGQGGQSETGSTIPVLLLAALNSGGKMLDPWGKPYRITIRQGTISSPSTRAIRTGFMIPNFYRLDKGERQ